MLRICSNDARMKIYGFKNRAGCRATYSALWRVRMIAFDLGRLSEHLGIDWDWSQLLKTPLSMILISHFLVNFATFVLLVLAASNPCLALFSFLMYCILC